MFSKTMEKINKQIQIAFLAMSKIDKIGKTILQSTN